MSKINYDFNFYLWDKNIKSLEYISKNMNQSAIKTAIKNAIKTNNYENYPDSDSHASNNTEDFNEIHGIIDDTNNYTNKNEDTYKNDYTNKMIKKKYINCFKCCFCKK